jgi:hypothetical protein
MVVYREKISGTDSVGAPRWENIIKMVSSKSAIRIQRKIEIEDYESDKRKHFTMRDPKTFSRKDLLDRFVFNKEIISMDDVNI